MAPTVQYVTGFNVKGFSTRTQNADEFNQHTAKLPALWQKFYSSDLASNAAVIAVYSNYESDVNGMYTNTVGIQSSEQADAQVLSGSYLVFQGKGPMPQTVIELWHQIWTYFSANSPQQRSYQSDFEQYKGSDEVAIYIGVR